MSSSKHYLDIFIRSNCGKQLKCTVCECWLPSSAEKFISSHISGRKHKIELEKKQKQDDKLKRSIYIHGFDPLLADLEIELHHYFESMGVSEVKDIYIDKNSKKYGIVEFVDESSVDTLLNQERKLFHNRTLTIKRREKNKKNVTSSMPPESIQVQDVKFLLPIDLREELNKLTKIDDEMKLLLNYYTLSEDDRNMRYLIGQLLQSVLEEQYPLCKVKLFGSSSNGLGERSCDVDVTLISNSIKDSGDGEVYAEVKELIQRFAPGCKSVSVVQSAKTCSIVKFKHTDSNLSVDLSLNNLLAVCNTELIKSYMEFDERVPLIMFTIRKWAKCFGLSGRNKNQITQYSLSIMIIYFLQRVEPPVLPCLQKCEQVNKVGEWNTSFSNLIKDNSFKNDSLAGDLLFDFFKFYGYFNFDLNIIAINTSEIITRDHVKLAVNELKLGDAEKDFNFGSPLVVQDPFKLTHNVTQNLSAEGLLLFLENFQQAYLRKSELNGVNLITIRHIFEMRKNCIPRKRQKKKRNRSNIYTISLPGCLHCSKSSDLNCVGFIRKILVEDLCMQISEISLDKNDFEKDDCSVLKKDFNEELVDKGTLGLKRILNDGDVDDSMHTSFKKRKLFESNQVSFAATAFNDTWTNRRKQRRLFQRIKEESKVETMEMPELNKYPDAGIVANNVPYVEESSLTCHPLFEFIVGITKGTDENSLCQLKLEPKDESKNKQDFQTFHAYLKKELISVFR